MVDVEVTLVRIIESPPPSAGPLALVVVELVALLRRVLCTTLRVDEGFSTARVVVAAGLLEVTGIRKVDSPQTGRY